MGKKCIFLLVFVVMMAAWGSVTSFATETSPNYLTLTEEDLGQRSLLGSPIKDRVDLFGRIVEFKSRLSNSIELGQRSMNVDAKKHADLIESAVRADAGISETDLPFDAPIYWMGYESRRGGEQVIRDRIWKGKPLPGFLIRIQDEGREYAYFIPKSCGNLSLVGERVLESPPKVVTPIPSPPIEERVKIVEKIIEKKVPVEKIVEVPVEKIVQVPVEKIVEVPVQVPGPTVPGPTQVVYVPQQTEQQIPWWAFLPPPPMIIGGGSGFGGYSGGCGGSGRQDYFGGNGNGGNWGRGRGNRGGQGVNVINNISLDNSSYSSSNATGGNARVDFNSSINNRNSNSSTNTNTNTNSNSNRNNNWNRNNNRQTNQGTCPTNTSTCPTNTQNSSPAPRTASDLNTVSGNTSGNSSQIGTAQAAQRSTSTTSRNSRSATRYNGTARNSSAYQQSAQMQSAMRSGRQAYSGANSSGRSQSYGGRSSVSGGRSFSGGNRMAGGYGGGGGRGGGGRGRR